MSTESQMERANSSALSPVPFAEEPKDAPKNRYIGFVMGSSCKNGTNNIMQVEFEKGKGQLNNQQMPEIGEGC